MRRRRRAPPMRARPAAMRLTPPAAARGRASWPVGGRVGRGPGWLSAGTKAVSADPTESAGEDVGAGPVETGGGARGGLKSVEESPDGLRQPGPPEPGELGRPGAGTPGCGGEADG